MIAVEAEKEFGWNYPSVETIKTYQDYRGLSTNMLDHCVTKEILLNGDQTEKEQRAIISWYHNRMAKATTAMPNSLFVPRCQEGLLNTKEHALSGKAGPL